MPTNISADIYALMTSCWNTIPSSRPTINQVQQRLKQSIKSEILATPRVSPCYISELVRFLSLILIVFQGQKSFKGPKPPKQFHVSPSEATTSGEEL